MTPRTLLLALLMGAPCARAAEPIQPPPPPAKSELLLPALDLAASTAPAPVRPSNDAARALSRAGWRPEDDGSLVRFEGKAHGVVPKSYLEEAKLVWAQGRLKYANSPAFLDYELYGRVLSGLQCFTEAAAVKPEAAGAALAAWGVPPTLVGRRLYEAGGKATYFGRMLHRDLARNPGAAATLGLERVEQVLSLYDEAYDQTFNQQSADIARGILERARAILIAPPRPGETSIASVLGGGSRQDPSAMLTGYRKALEKDIQAAKDASDAARLKASEQALAVLNTLERQRVYAEKTLTDVPAPSEAGGTPGGTGASSRPDKPAYAPLSSGLPGLLSVLDRVNGAPLTAEQQRDLIQSFPMGDLVWRTGAHQIWRQGLTGKGVKVAVIDQGVAEHPELDGAVDARVNLTAQRGAASVGDHGTHVAGIIHALAPDARINSYAVFPGGVFGQANRKLMENPEPAIIKAVHQAVADGNQVINMSLSSGEGPSGPLAKVVEEYAARGVIFMVSAGNARNYAGGVGSPSSAGSVVSVGSTEWSGHMSDFTSFGERFDARTLQTVVKDVFLFPGGDIVSTMPQMPFSFGDKEPRYASMSGTSMAAPGLSGVVALMVQDLAAAPVKLNPLATADRIRTALRMGSEHMSLDRLPLGVPLDQPFLVVHPTRAVEALRREDSVAERTGM